MTDFSSLDLAAPIAAALAAQGYQTPTPIQQKAIPLALGGRDLFGIAQTGTGKTAAFALPILDRIARRPAPLRKRAPRMLVLAPTRELAAQIAISFKTYGSCQRVSVMTAFGGAPIRKQIRQLERGVDILVATPGRLNDLAKQGAVQLGQVEILVLDEADQMLDLGFIHDLRRIVAMLPEDRQTLFFSATMPKPILQLAKQFLKDPARVEATPPATTAARVAQYATFVAQGDKQELLNIFLREAPIERAIVFTRTKHGADRVVKNLARVGIDAEAIHGNKSQPQRERALAAFRNGKCSILVATDIAARGIDVSGISHVVNFELPNVPEQYVHRIGRTARAGAAGAAISFVANDERPHLRSIEKLTGQRLEFAPLPPSMQDKAPAPVKSKSDNNPVSKPKRRPKFRPRSSNPDNATDSENNKQRPARPRRAKKRAIAKPRTS